MGELSFVIGELGVVIGATHSAQRVMASGKSLDDLKFARLLSHQSHHCMGSALALFPRPTLSPPRANTFVGHEYMLIGSRR